MNVLQHAFGWVWITCMSMISIAFHSLLVSARSWVPNPLESRVPTNWSFLSSWENPNPSWSFLKFSSFFDLLGKISWGYVRRLVAEVSSKFHWIWTSFAWDSSFEVLFTGFFWVSPVRSDDKTGQTGQELFRPRPVRPVCCTGQTGPGSRVLRFALYWLFCFRVAS